MATAHKSQWNRVKLGDVAIYRNEKVSYTVLNRENYISTDNMAVNKGGITQSEYVPMSGKSTKYEIGDILLSNIRPYFRKLWLADKNGGCSNDVIVFKARENIKSNFLYYCLSDNYFFDFVMSGSNGTKMPRGNKDSMRNYEINLPNLPTQKRIADVLSAYDDLIENNNKRIKVLEQMAQKLYTEWFVHFKFPGHEKTKKVDSGHKDYGMIPEGWSIKRLDEISNILSGFAFKGEDFQDQGIPVVKIKNITGDNTVNTFDTDFISEKNLNEKIKKYILKNGDIVVAMTGATAGKVGRISGHKILLLNQRVAKI